MIISGEQAQLVLECLRTTRNEEVREVRSDASAANVSAELIARVTAALAEVPDTRQDRIERARAGLAVGRYSADDVADKIVARMISDCLR